MPPVKSVLPWAVLGLLLAALLAGAATFDPRSWPGVVGDEASYLMQAQSLAWDGDLRYSRADFDRFVAQRGTRPEGLILQSADGGRTLSYGKPAPYSLYLAPFVRLAPLRGPAVANALLLVLVAIVAARALGRRLGDAAPLWAAAFVFGSVAFAYVFWAHADLFLMCLSTLGLSLVYGAPAEAPTRRALLRFLAAGALLGVVAVDRPPYATLLLPALLAIPAAHRELRRWTWSARGALLGGALAVAIASGLVGLAARGAWSSYGGERQSFYSYVGFPEVDLPADSWALRARRVSGSWIEPQTFALGLDARQTGWNVVYFLLGRHVGVLPYFLPLTLGLLAFRPGEGRWALIAAVAGATAVFLYIRPFNFWGGGGAIANRYFLPLYPACWFLAARPPRGAWGKIAYVAPLAAAALAAPFLLPLWRSPRAYPVDADGGYRWVSTTAHQLLPYETTLSHLKPSGRDDFLENGLWIKPLTTTLRAEGEGVRIRLTGEEGELLVGDLHPMTSLRLRFPPPGRSRIVVDGEELTTTPRPEGGSVVRLQLGRPRARHRMWWTEDFYLYELKISLPQGEPTPPGGVVFQLLGDRRPVSRPPIPDTADGA